MQDDRRFRDKCIFSRFPSVLVCIIRVASLAFLIESLEENIFFNRNKLYVSKNKICC